MLFVGAAGVRFSLEATLDAAQAPVLGGGERSPQKRNTPADGVYLYLGAPTQKLTKICQAETGAKVKPSLDALLVKRASSRSRARWAYSSALRLRNG